MTLAVDSWPARVKTNALPMISESVRACLGIAPSSASFSPKEDAVGDSSVPAPINAPIRSRFFIFMPELASAFLAWSISFRYLPHSM